MDTKRYEQRLATGTNFKIPKGANGDHNLEVDRIFLTATALSTVVFSDGTKSVTFDVGAGSFVEFCGGITFTGDADITVTATGGTCTVICDVKTKR